MDKPSDDYPVIGFQWQLLALVANMWTKERFGVDVERRLGEDRLRTVIDDEFCRTVAEEFRRYWTRTDDPDRRERVTRTLVEIDEMVAELFEENDALRRRFAQKCRRAGIDLDEPINA